MLLSYHSSLQGRVSPMASNTSSYRIKISKYKIFLTALILYIVSQISIMIITKDLRQDFLMLQLTSSSDVFLKIVTSWKDAGFLNAYYNHFYFDFAHPVIYSIFLSSLLARGFIKRNITDRLDFVLFLPYLAGMLDLVENSIHLYLLADLTRITPSIVLAGSVFTWTKWVLALSTLAAGVFMLFSPSKKDT